MRILILLVLTCLSLTLDAQMRRGDRLLSLVNSGPAIPIYTPAVESFNVGQFYYSPADRAAAVFLTPQYGFLLADRFALGGQLSFIEGSDFDAFYGLFPYARYYLLNEANLMGYVQLSSAIGNLEGYDNDFTAFQSATATAGIQLPLGRGALLTPALSYWMAEGPNTLGLGVDIELILGRNNRSEDGPVASFGEGSIMLGGTFASLAHRESFWGGDVSLGGHYFFNERFALGLGAAYGFTNLKFSTTSGDFNQKTSNITLSAVPRLYLSTQRRTVWYVDGGVHYWRWGNTFDPGRDAYSEGHFSLGLGAGAQVFVRDNVALEIGPQYRYFFDDEENFGLLGLNFGVRYFL